MKIVTLNAQLEKSRIHFNEKINTLSEILDQEKSERYEWMEKFKKEQKKNMETNVELLESMSNLFY